MPFNPRSAGNPTQAANNWSIGVQQSGAKLLAGYSNPRRNPQANPSAATAAWTAGVSKAAPDYSAGLTGYSADAAIASMQANGVPRYTASATTKKQNYATVAAQLIPAIQSIAQNLPADRSTLQARIARMTAQVTQAAALRGKFRKSRAA